jgi:hypothetical protein
LETQRSAQTFSLAQINVGAITMPSPGSLSPQILGVNATSLPLLDGIPYISCPLVTQTG